MTLETNALTTYTAKGNREDLADTIWLISPTKTPIVAAIDKVEATAVLH